MTEYAGGIHISVWDWLRDTGGYPTRGMGRCEADRWAADQWDQNPTLIADPVNFELLSSKADFVFIRFMDANGMTDKASQPNWEGVGKYKKPRSPFLNWVTGRNVASLATQFYDSVNNLGQGLGELPPTLDYEPSTPGNPDEIYFLLDSVNKLFHHPQGVLLYSSKAFISALNPIPTWADGSVPWIKRWVASWTTALNPTMPPGWGTTWDFWQHTANEDGYSYGLKSTKCDHNRFNGTVSDLTSWLRKPPPTSLEDMIKALEAMIMVEEQEVTEIKSRIAILDDRIRVIDGRLAVLENETFTAFIKRMFG